MPTRINKEASVFSKVESVTACFHLLRWAVNGTPRGLSTQQQPQHTFETRPFVAVELHAAKGWKVIKNDSPACYFSGSRPAGWPNSGRPAGHVLVVVVVVV